MKINYMKSIDECSSLELSVLHIKEAIRNGINPYDNMCKFHKKSLKYIKFLDKFVEYTNKGNIKQ